ncbi:putative thymidylate kinase, partial [Operophtera brumata]
MDVGQIHNKTVHRKFENFERIMKRGALIVIEGVDRTGKSTQARTLVESLKKKHVQAEYTNFPARDTDIGKVINGYLSSK